MRCFWAITLVISGCGGESFEIGVADSATPVTLEDSGPSAETSAEPDSAPVPDTYVELDTGVALPDAEPETIVPDAANDATPDVLPCDSPVLCFVDKDGDGFAASTAESMAACACPKGWTAKSPAITVDCNDEDPRVFPGATAFYPDPYCVPGSSCAVKSFDYNCNGSEERQFGVFTSCASGCVGAGFSATIACGGSATLTQCKTDLICKQVTSSWKQGCR